MSSLWFVSRFLRESASSASKHANDAFISILQAAYKGTHRGSEVVNTKMRCSLISADGGTIHAFDFEEERDYWCADLTLLTPFSLKYNWKCRYFINAVKLAVLGESVHFSCKCLYVPPAGSGGSRNSGLRGAGAEAGTADRRSGSLWRAAGQTDNASAPIIPHKLHAFGLFGGCDLP